MVSLASSADRTILITGVIEESLGQLENVQTRLAQNERDLQDEIAELQGELKREQNPNRMQSIQEMISVRKFSDISAF